MNYIFRTIQKIKKVCYECVVYMQILNFFITYCHKIYTNSL